MRPVNLIPPEDRRGERAPLRAGPLSYVIVAALLLAFVGVYMLVAAGNSVTEGEDQVAGLEQQLESTTARAEALQSFTGFAALEQNRTATVSSLARSRFDWERVMRELALVIPEDVSLSALSGAVSGDGAAESAPSGSAIAAPTMTMSGCGDDHESVARFVAALRDIDGVTRVGLASSTAGSTDGTAEGAAAPAGGAVGAGCRDPKAAQFEATIAFDEVQIDPASAAAVPSAPVPAGNVPVAGDGSGVADAQQERQGAQDSVDKAESKSREAVDRYVPGA
ncbi:MAG: PilN domain-containing protein [Solirubrobacterales bacterium]